MLDPSWAHLSKPTLIYLKHQTVCTHLSLLLSLLLLAQSLCVLVQECVSTSDCLTSIQPMTGSQALAPFSSACHLDYCDPLRKCRTAFWRNGKSWVLLSAAGVVEGPHSKVPGLATQGSPAHTEPLARPSGTPGGCSSTGSCRGDPKVLEASAGPGGLSDQLQIYSLGNALCPFSGSSLHRKACHTLHLPWSDRGWHSALALCPSFLAKASSENVDTSCFCLVQIIGRTLHLRCSLDILCT